MKKLLLSLLYVGFTQSAFGASKVPKEVNVDPVRITLEKVEEVVPEDDENFVNLNYGTMFCNIYSGVQRVGAVRYEIGIEQNQKTLIIVAISIDEEQRRKDFGSVAVKALQEMIRPNYAIAESVNPKACRFWIKLGYSPMDDCVGSDYCCSFKYPKDDQQKRSEWSAIV